MNTIERLTLFETSDFGPSVFTPARVQLKMSQRFDPVILLSEEAFNALALESNKTRADLRGFTI
jgi:hypothetical protein